MLKLKYFLFFVTSAIYWRVKSLLGFDTVNNAIYAVSYIGKTVVRSLDPGYKRWEVISPKDWTNIMDKASTTWATEIPFIPETDDVSMTLEPRTPLTKTAANGDKWGGDAK